MTEIGIEQARGSLGDIADRAADAGTITYLTRRGRRIAAVVPLERIMQTAIPNTFTADTAVRTLTDRGYQHADVIAAFDSLVNAGLELDQPDDGYLLTAGEIGVLDRQLFEATGTVAVYTQEGRIRVDYSNGDHGADVGYYDADGGTWKDEVREVLRAAGWESKGPWIEDTETSDSMMIVTRSD